MWLDDSTPIYGIIIAELFIYIIIILSLIYIISLLRTSGVTDHLALDDNDALRIARNIVSNLNWQEGTLTKQAYATAANRTSFLEPAFPVDEMGAIIPADTKKPFDVRKIIARIADGSRFHEFKKLYAPTIVTGFMQLYGMQVGIVANNGILYSESSLKVIIILS